MAPGHGPSAKGIFHAANIPAKVRPGNRENKKGGRMARLGKSLSH
jgi:hypothetical protein